MTEYEPNGIDELDTLSSLLDSDVNDLQADLNDATILEGGSVERVPKVTIIDAMDHINSFGSGPEEKTEHQRGIAHLFRKK